MPPKISVICSVYNGALYLKEAVQSILNQTFSDFEFIIINDGSTDETQKILSSFTDSRIICLKNKENIGLVRSLNKGLSIAQGEFIARMDADDISLPNRFAKQIAYFKKNPQVSVLGTAISQIDNQGQPISVLVPPISHALIFWKIFFGCPVFHPTVMIKKNILTAVGYYDVNFSHIEDIDLWSRLLLHGAKFANLPEILHIRRLHNSSIISTKFAIQCKKGIIIRKHLLESLLNHEVPDDIITWFLKFDRPLNRSQRIIALTLLLELYDKIIQVNLPIISEKSSLHMDLLYRINLIYQSLPKFLLRQLILCLSKVLSVPSRHKLKILLGKYLKCFLLENNN